MTVEIKRGSRVVHSMYGRGAVEEIERQPSHAFVAFDGDPCRRRVRMRDLLPEPEKLGRVAFLRVVQGGLSELRQ